MRINLALLLVLCACGQTPISQAPTSPSRSDMGSIGTSGGADYGMVAKVRIQDTAEETLTGFNEGSPTAMKLRTLATGAFEVKTVEGGDILYRIEIRDELLVITVDKRMVDEDDDRRWRDLVYSYAGIL